MRPHGREARACREMRCAPRVAHALADLVESPLVNEDFGQAHEREEGHGQAELQARAASLATTPLHYGLVRAGARMGTHATSAHPRTHIRARLRGHANPCARGRSPADAYLLLHECGALCAARAPQIVSLGCASGCCRRGSSAQGESDGAIAGDRGRHRDATLPAMHDGGGLIANGGRLRYAALRSPSTHGGGDRSRA